MAKGKRIIALDVGASSVKLAEFSLSKGGQLILNQSAVASLGLDPHNEDDRAAMWNQPLENFWPNTISPQAPH